MDNLEKNINLPDNDFSASTDIDGSSGCSVTIFDYSHVPDEYNLMVFGKETITFIVKDPAGAVAKVPVNFEVKHVNAVPEIRPIRDVTMREDANNGVLATIKLDQYVRDRDNSFNELKWTITGNKKLVTSSRSSNRMKTGVARQKPSPSR